MLNTILCKLSTPEIIAIVIVGLFILSGPVLFNLFGKENKKEDSCGSETLWDRLKRKCFGK